MAFRQILALAMISIALLAVACACSRGKPSPDVQEWEVLQAELPRLDKREQVVRLEAFLERHPATKYKKRLMRVHSRTPQYQASLRLDLLRKELGLEDAKRKRAAEEAARRAAKKAALRAKERHAERAALLRGPLPRILEIALFQALQSSSYHDPRSRPLATRTTFSLDNRRVTSSNPYDLGLSHLRAVLLGLTGKPRSFWSQRLGGELQRPDEPTRYDPRLVRRALAESWIDPDAALLGAKASEVYAPFRELVRQYAKVYLVLRREGGRRRFERAYLQALKSKPGAMITFYRKYLVDQRIDIKARTLNRPGNYVAVGFWMRRMIDGTDGVVFRFLDRLLRAFDPLGYKKLRGGVRAARSGGLPPAAMLLDPRALGPGARAGDTVEVLDRKLVDLFGGLDPSFSYQVIDPHTTHKRWVPGQKLRFDEEI